MQMRAMRSLAFIAEVFDFFALQTNVAHGFDADREMKIDKRLGYHLVGLFGLDAFGHNRYVAHEQQGTAWNAIFMSDNEDRGSLHVNREA